MSKPKKLTKKQLRALLVTLAATCTAEAAKEADGLALQSSAAYDGAAAMAETVIELLDGADPEEATAAFRPSPVPSRRLA